MGVLVSPDAIDPRLTYRGAVKHHVDLLTMVPGLRVLVSVALDANVFVDNHDFDVAVALLFLRYDGLALVFGDVKEVVKLLLACI